MVSRTPLFLSRAVNKSGILVDSVDFCVTLNQELLPGSWLLFIWWLSVVSNYKWCVTWWCNVTRNLARSKRSCLKTTWTDSRCFIHEQRCVKCTLLNHRDRWLNLVYQSVILIAPLVITDVRGRGPGEGRDTCILGWISPRKKTFKTQSKYIHIFIIFQVLKKKHLNTRFCMFC